ncbi:MAG TPA: FHA domain-containing protein [Polyangia bacterium]|nr:FHA domain-containing protein [Polyangia bacterium]
MFKLTIEDDEGKTTVVPVIRDEMTIGRDAGNTIRLTERNVSRRHARLMRQSGSIFVEDLKSFTGVRVNGAKITAPTAVSEGDQLQIGDYKIRVKSDRPSEMADRPTRPAMAAVNGNDGVAAYAPTPPIRTTSVANVPASAPVAQPNTAVTSMGRAVTPRPVAAHGMPVPDLLPVPDPLEAQPTIPLRMLSDVDPSLGPGQIASPPVSPARLVVLTTELAGKEFALDRASLVIGRTNENDVVLNHRSISRHHAKIVQDRDHFTIVDLQSANGVRVNGEDYERIELHPGDVVELGHVRIRFVGPLESYVFDPLARSNRGRSKMAFALAGLFVAAGLGLVLQRTLGPRGDDGSAAIAARPPAPPPTPAEPAAAVTAPPNAASAPAPTTTGADELLAQATAQAKSESWDAGLATLDRLSALMAATAPSDAAVAVKKQAGELRQRLETERRNAIVYAKFDESAQQKNYPSAVDWYSELPEESVYKARARPRFTEAKSALVGQYLAAAEKLRQVGKCADLRQEVELIDRIDPHNAVAQDKLRLCRPRSEGALAVAATARAAAPRPAAASLALANRRSAGASDGASRRGTASESAATPARRSTEIATTAPLVESDGGDADVLMKQARDAWLRQQCGSAIDLSRKAIRARPGMVDAYQVIAVCSCSLKDAEGATRAYAKLDDKSRNLVRTLCQRNGIAVSE